MKNKRTRIIVLIFGLILLVVLPTAWILSTRNGSITLWMRNSLGITDNSTESSATTTEVIAPAPDRTRPLAVMIDNHPDARPQSGVAAADVVWEVPVEGGLTRNMFIFRSTEAKEIGPVRSARPYFLSWASEYDAIYAHVGGSDESLANLASGKYGLDDANEFRFGSAFFRDNRRSAPHNTYTSTTALRSLAEQKGWADSTEAIDATTRLDSRVTGTEAKKAVITPVTGGDTSEFRWEEEAGGYSLWRDGRKFYDRNGTPIIPKTVIVLETKMIPISDPYGKGLIGLETTSSGQATVLRDGVAIKGTWKKPSSSEPTQIYAEDGSKIPFKPGQLWYAVVASNRGGGIEIVLDPKN